MLFLVSLCLILYYWGRVLQSPTPKNERKHNKPKQHNSIIIAKIAKVNKNCQKKQLIVKIAK